MEIVTGTLLPAFTEKGEAGEVVAPAGSPESETDTAPVKPPCGVMETFKMVLAPPAGTLMEVGERESAKFCAAVTVTGRAVECERFPETPSAVTV
jgi:hypothetical protein